MARHKPNDLQKTVRSLLRQAINSFNQRPSHNASPYKRRPIRPSVRFDILTRDQYRCVCCGRSAADGVKLEVDHIIPVSKGGTNHFDNLQTLCADCNRGKSAK
jgi:5-methylcytosine-specific restriction enzyme A